MILPWRYWFVLLILCTGFVNAQETVLDEWLDLDLNQLMTIRVTTATKSDRSLNDVPATVRIISADQIRERGYNSLEDVLQDLPGFQFRNIQGFNAYTFMRGAPSQNNLVLVLIDGIQINELSSGGFYGGYQYNLHNVKQIEVVYGPSSALYGTNAISGIINIITKDIPAPAGGTIDVTAGNWGTLFGDGEYGFTSAAGEIGGKIAVHYKRTTKADLGGAAGDDNWSDRMENFENDLGCDAKFSYRNFCLGLTMQDKQAARTTNYKSNGTDYLDRNTNWHIRFINAYAKHVVNAKDKWTLKSLGYFRNATVVDNTIAYIRADSAQQIGQVGYFRPNALFGLEEQLDYYFNEDASVILGVVGEAEKLAADFSQTFSGDPHVRPPRPPAPDFEKNTLASFYAQTHYRFYTSLELTAGARLDRSSYYGTVLTPRLGLVYHRKAYTAKILYMEAFRAPKPWDYNWGDGNPDLKPEQMRSFELAGICTPNKYLRMEVNLYSNLVFEKLTQTTNKWINAEQLKTNGLEANLDYSRNKTQWNVNYTLTDSKYADGSCVPEIARHSFNAGVSYSFSRQLNCNLRGNYLGARRNPAYITASHSFNVDAYFILNGTINYHPLTRLDMQLCVNNILNAVYYHTSNRPPERYRQPQRSVLVSLSYQL